MKLNASKHPPMGKEKRHRSRRIAGGPADVPGATRQRVPGVARALIALGVLISGFMISSAAPPPAAPGAALAPFTETVPGSVVKIPMIPIPGATVKIGTRTVTVKPFWMARTETPWEAFDAFTASGPSSPPYDQTAFAPDAIARPSKSYILPDLGWGHNGYPVINVSFLAAQMFCRWLAAAARKHYRLPTEAEWELACRAGAAGPWKIDPALLEKSAWYAGNSAGTTHPVGKKLPNQWGLCDMLGNVGEWAADLDGKPVLCGGTFLDGPAAITPGTRRRQTPQWQETDPQFPKSRWWLADGKFVGFRIVCEP